MSRYHGSWSAKSHWIVVPGGDLVAAHVAREQVEEDLHRLGIAADRAAVAGAEQPGAQQRERLRGRARAA